MKSVKRLLQSENSCWPTALPCADVRSVLDCWTEDDILKLLCFGRIQAKGWHCGVDPYPTPPSLTRTDGWSTVQEIRYAAFRLHSLGKGPDTEADSNYRRERRSSAEAEQAWAANNAAYAR